MSSSFGGGVVRLARPARALTNEQASSRKTLRLGKDTLEGEEAREDFEARHEALVEELSNHSKTSCVARVESSFFSIGTAETVESSSLNHGPSRLDRGS